MDRPLEPYEKIISPASEAITALYQEVLADLDVDEGGISWWNGHIGWKRSALIGEYLLSSIHGIRGSLLRASLAIEEYKTTEFSQNNELVMGWRAVEKQGGSEEDLVAVTSSLGAKGTKRERLLSTWSDTALSSLAQALDRVAAVLVMVSGVKDDVLRTDWGTVRKLAETALRNVPPQGVAQQLGGRLAHPGSPGRQRQNDLLGMILNADAYGPTDWLAWLQKSRNTATHRAPRITWKMMVAGKGRIPEGLIEPFWTQPEWADTEAMLRNAGKSFSELLILERPYDVLDGLRASVVELVAVIADACKDLWIDRRADPSLIVQHGGIWPDVETTAPLSFPGYGKPAKLLFRDVRLHPDTGKRLRAAHVLDEKLKRWKE